MTGDHLALPLMFVLSLAQSALAQTPDEIVSSSCPVGVTDSLPAIAGTVRDASTGEPVARARVRLTTLDAPDSLQAQLLADEISAYVTTGNDGSYAICSVLTGSRTLLHATRGDRASAFVALFFLGGGVSTGGEFHALETPIWHQDFDLLPREQQTAVVIGQVTDTAAAPVVAAEVRLLGTGRMARTDASGHFAFRGLAPGFVRLEVRRLGFRRLGRDVELIPGDTVDLSTSSLEHLPIRLAPLTITGVAPSEKLRDVGFLDRRRASGTGSFLTMTEYRARRGDPARTTEVLLSMRGITSRMTFVGEGLGHPTVGFTRCRTAAPAIYVDGWYMGTGAQVDVDFLAPADWLEAVEAYPNRSFVNIGRKVVPGCGGIYFWTKPFDNEPEEDIPVEPGARVRVTAPAAGLRRFVGEYVAGTRDTVYIRGEAGAAPFAVPLPSVTLLELRTGAKRRRLLAAGVGFAVGAIVGIVSAPPDDGVIWSSLRLGVPTSFAGLFVGSFLKTDRWEEAVRTDVQVGGAPQRGAGVGLTVSFQF